MRIPQSNSRSCILLFTLYLLVVGSAHSAHGQLVDWEQMKSITPRGYVCGIASTPIAIDGKLDDVVWQTATWTEDFVDIEGMKKAVAQIPYTSKDGLGRRIFLHRRRAT